jgi:hypothetical protein
VNVEKGLIRSNQSETLHEIRLLGNDATHELHQPDTEVQKSAIEIMEHVLSQIYENPGLTKMIQNRKANPGFN